MDECRHGRPECECTPGVLASEIELLMKQNDRARNRLAHYAAALTKAWELLDDVVQSPEDDDDYSLTRKLQVSVYDEAVAMRRAIGMLLQGEPWDGDGDLIQELLTIRRDLTKDILHDPPNDRR